MLFKDLDLLPAILKALEDSGYSQPTPIQEEAIPQILQGADLHASAQTGTGKTAAYLLPALNRLGQVSLSGPGPRILILVPTRELAMQVSSQAVKYSKYLSRAKTVCIYGGASYVTQNRDLSRPYEILVATPGRLIDHMERGRIHFSRLEMLILDEADRMLDMGFIGPVQQIADATPKGRQTLMFSATLKGSVLNLCKRLLNNPKEICIKTTLKASESIEQKLYHADNLNHKYQLVGHLLKDPTVNQAIVFTSTKSQADNLVGKLLDDGFKAGALHGDMNQRQRTRTIMELREGRIKILVATDVAGRGIDVLNITHVINFDLPHNTEDYVHRIGRTGRAGATGLAHSLVSPKDRALVKGIERFTGTKLQFETIPGMESQPSNEPNRKKEFKPKRKFGFNPKFQRGRRGNYSSRRQPSGSHS